MFLKLKILTIAYNNAENNFLRELKKTLKFQSAGELCEHRKNFIISFISPVYVLSSVS